MTLRVVLADDERPARSYLTSLLRAMDDITIVGEAASGVEAVPLIERTRPDLALLDVQMPGLDGFQVVKALRRDRLPLIVFVTAHDEYAVRAFEANAADYLLKPVRRTRLRDALVRARERIEDRGLRDEEAARAQAAATQYETLTGPFIERLPVRRRDDVIIVAVLDIASLEADGETVRVTTVSGERHVLSHSLREIEARLDPARFLRLSRGAVANVSLITRVSPLPGGGHLVHLKNGQDLRVSRQQSRVLRTHLLKL